MSGFDPAWLDLREPADGRARAASLLDRVGERFGACTTIHVADLAAGSGSTLRALAPRLGGRQRWTLIDHDVALLAHARDRLARWADAASEEGGVLRLVKDGRAIEVETELADLARDPLPASAAGADLVTASAFFDLVGEAWLIDFAARLASSGRPLYAALSYDGQKSFAPAHPLDGAVLAAFNAHQGGDKGFGPALGPSGASRLKKALEAAGYVCETAPSPWRLGPADHALTSSLVEGIAGAAAETAKQPKGIADWLAARLATVSNGSAEIGHVDLFCAP